MNLKDAQQGLILVVSATESFLAKSLISKLEGSGSRVAFSRGEISEIEELRAQIDLIILFAGEGMEEMTDSLVYIKDLASELDRRIVLIGDEVPVMTVKKTIPEILILSWFKRPLVMDDLIGCVVQYMVENTGERAKRTILIVDDDITYMRTVYEWLKSTYHVAMAQNGVQAISFLARNKVDLVLLDYEMPIANGPQVLEMLKSESDTGQIPVMFLTGHGDRDSVLSVVGLCPVDYLLKASINKTSLLEKLEEFFNRPY